MCFHYSPDYERKEQRASLNDIAAFVAVALESIK